MKRLIVLNIAFVTVMLNAQKTPSAVAQQTRQTNPPMDSLTYSLLSTTIKMIKLAQDPKKVTHYFMPDLPSTDYWGKPVFKAPYSIAGYTATIRKTETNRTAGTTTWEWSTEFSSPFPAYSKEQIKITRARLDSLVHQLKYTYGKTLHTIGYMYVSFSEDDKNPSIHMGFQKPLHNTAAQAKDSLLALYKPILLKPAFAGEATRKLWGGFLAEGFTDPEILTILKPLFTEIAGKNLEAAYQILVEVPNNQQFEELKQQLTQSQRDEIKKLAQKVVDDYYAEQRRKFQGDPVMQQQQEIKQQKQLAACPDMPLLLQKQYQLGVTVSGTIGLKHYVAQLVSVDCNGKKVKLVSYGHKRKGQNEIIQLDFLNYNSWSKTSEQYYRCSHCGGEGGEMVTETASKVKELPFGYFSGIETKVHRTTTKTYWEDCYYCHGTGWELLPEKN